jgi:uncharacterized membrane protein YfcA
MVDTEGEPVADEPAAASNPLTPAPTAKSLVKKSEAWLSAIAAIGAVLTAYLSHIPGAATWVALGVCLALTAVFAFFKTPLASAKKPGIKTKTFWTSVIVVVGSIAAAVSEIDIAGVPAKVTQVAGMISAATMALGYNVWRVKDKAKGAR